LEARAIAAPSFSAGVSRGLGTDVSVIILVRSVGVYYVHMQQAHANLNFEILVSALLLDWDDVAVLRLGRRGITHVQPQQRELVEWILVEEYPPLSDQPRGVAAGVWSTSADAVIARLPNFRLL